MAAIDAALDANRDLAVVSRFVTGIELVEQRIAIRLQRGTREWFLDPEGVGLPLIAWREQKPPDLVAISIRIQQEILSIPGVVRVENVETLHDSSARRVTFRGDVFINEEEVTTVVAIVGETAVRNLAILAIQFPSRSINRSVARPTSAGFKIG